MALQFQTSVHDHGEVLLILMNWLQSNSEVSSDDIAGKIDAYHGRIFEEENRIPKEEKEEVEPDGCYGPLWEIWIAFIIIVEQIPHGHSAQSKLVSVINGLKGLAGRKIDLEDDELQLWKDLPIFDICIRDYYQPSLNTTSPIPSDEAQKWHNVTSFLARCWQAGFFNASPQALRSFRAILEQPVTDISALQQALPIVLEWIMHSGIALYQSIESPESQEGSREQSAGSLYTGPNQLCVERWQFWKNRLEELAGQLQGHSKEMALDCASKMESISS